MTAYTQKDFEAIEAAVLESPRGRWFLGEFTRRNRAADTLMLLDAIRKLERGVAENAPQVTGELAADLQDLSETITSTIVRGAGEDDLRATLDQLARVKDRIDRLLAETGAADGGLTAENLEFFAGDEDLFEVPPAAAPAPSLMVVGEQPERTMPPRKPAEAAKGDPKDRIVFIRRGSSQEAAIPLADEADDPLPEGQSQPGS